MSDHPEETGLDGTSVTPEERAMHDEAMAPQSPGIFAANPDKLDVFDFDDFLTNAKRVTRTGTICIDGTLEDQWRLTIEELSGLVDDDGNPIAGDEASLADKGKIAQLEAKALDLKTRMRAASRAIVFEAMPSDEWDKFDDSHRNSNGRVRDAAKWVNEMVAECAISPKLSLDQVAKIRSTVSKSQMTELGNAAFRANTMGGTTIPKSPSYLQTPELEASLSSFD